MMEKIFKDIVFWAFLTFASGRQALSFGMVAAIIRYSSLSVMGALYPFRFSGNRLLKELLFCYAPSIYAVLLLFGIIPEILGEGGGVQRNLAEFGMFFALCAPIMFVGFRVLKVNVIPGSDGNSQSASVPEREKRV